MYIFFYTLDPLKLEYRGFAKGNVLIDFALSVSSFRLSV